MAHCALQVLVNVLPFVKCNLGRKKKRNDTDGACFTWFTSVLTSLCVPSLYISYCRVLDLYTVWLQHQGSSIIAEFKSATGLFICCTNQLFFFFFLLVLCNPYNTSCHTTVTEALQLLNRGLGQSGREHLSLSYFKFKKIATIIYFWHVCLLACLSFYVGQCGVPLCWCVSLAFATELPEGQKAKNQNKRQMTGQKCKQTGDLSVQILVYSPFFIILTILFNLSFFFCFTSVKHRFIHASFLITEQNANCDY